jgi:hypothetical protein
MSPLKSVPLLYPQKGQFRVGSRLVWLESQWAEELKVFVEPHAASGLAAGCLTCCAGIANQQPPSDIGLLQLPMELP